MPQLKTKLRQMEMNAMGIGGTATTMVSDFVV